MAYTKQTWQSGDVVTSAKLNYIEDGIVAAGADVFTVTGIFSKDGENDRVDLDKTWQEIHDAFVGGSLVCINEEMDDGSCYQSLVLQVSQMPFDEDMIYLVNTYMESFTIETPNGYPCVINDIK